MNGFSGPKSLQDLRNGPLVSILSSKTVAATLYSDFQRFMAQLVLSAEILDRILAIQFVYHITDDHGRKLIPFAGLEIVTGSGTNMTNFLSFVTKKFTLSQNHN